MSLPTFSLHRNEFFGESSWILDKLGMSYVDHYSQTQILSIRIFFFTEHEISIAPDYILCSKKAEKSFIDVAKQVMAEWYGEKLQENPDMPRMVNERHFNRLKGLLESTKGRLVFGGKYDADDLWIEPTIIGKAKFSLPILERWFI